MSYWYLGNRQTFFNTYLPISTSFKEHSNPQHPLLDYSNGVDHTLIVLLMIPIVLFHKKVIKYTSYLFIRLSILRNMHKLNRIIYKDINIDESLGHFNSCMRGIDQKAWYVNEHYNRK